MSREVEMTEKTVMTTDTSCGSLNTQAYDLKSHACSLPQPILKKAAYVGSNKQELIKAVSQSLMEAVNSGEIYDLLDVFNKAGLEFTEEMICELKGKLNAREMRELERQIQEIRLVLEKKEAEESFQERSESVTDLRADLSAENGDEKSVAFPDTQNDDHEKCGEAEGQNSTAEKQKAESSSLKKEGKEEDGDQARHCEQTQGMQGQNLAQVQVQEASEDDGTTSFSNIFVRIFGGLLRKWKEASKKSQFVAEVQSDDRDVVVPEGDTGRQAMPDEDSNLGTNAQSR